MQHRSTDALRPLDHEVLPAIAHLAASGIPMVTPLEVATVLAEQHGRRLRHLIASGVLYRALAQLTGAGLLVRCEDVGLPAGVARHPRWRYALTTAGWEQLAAE
jgi:hypothetical protein